MRRIGVALHPGAGGAGRAPAHTDDTPRSQSACVEAIEHMRSRGAEIMIVPTDVADRQAVESVLREIPSSHPLRGILHAAGVLDDHSLLEQTPASLVSVLRPKWLGAWNLHTLTRKQNLDFFVLFSSAAVVLGSPGQANYAAANAALDALADYRRQLGLPALSLQWGPWNSTGMAAKLAADLPAMGIGKIDFADGVAAVDRLLGRHEAVAAVLRMLSWEKFVSRRPKGTTALFSRLVEANFQENKRHEAGKDPQQNQRSLQFFDLLQGAPPADRQAMLAEHLRQQALKILSLPAHTRIDEDEALHDLGLDSLMAVELRNALAERLREAAVSNPGAGLSDLAHSHQLPARRDVCCVGNYRRRRKTAGQHGCPQRPRGGSIITRRIGKAGAWRTAIIPGKTPRCRQGSFLL